MVVLIFFRAMGVCDAMSIYVRGQNARRRVFATLRFGPPMGSTTRNVLIAAAVALGGAGCAGAGGASRGGGNASQGENIQGERSGQEKLTEYDLNRDGKPDVWSYSVRDK